VDLGRRRLVRGASIAAGAAAIGATTDGLLARQAAPGSGDDAEETLIPNAGHWRTVMASADLPEDGVRGFNLDTVTGFVVRGGGQLGAVSGVCTHLGCRLRLAASALRLNCPCHNASFDLGGQVLHHQLPEAPGPLPHLRVREVDGKVQVFAPRTLGT
jgi:cytochrome b6-f complex iron-sulfur subunit